MYAPKFADDSQPWLPMTDATARARAVDFDYIEEEWFATGEDETGHPYVTTVFVRRPRDTSRFSGTVVMEPVHFGSVLPVYMYSSEYIMRSGHAWAYVASQKCAVDGHIKPFDAERYEALDIYAEPGVPGADALDFTQLAMDRDDAPFWWESLSRVNGAGNSILAQVGAAFGESAGPLDGLDVRNVLLTGHSYTGYVTSRYIREAHDVMRLADGSAPFDGYFPSGWPSWKFGPCEVPIVETVCEGDFDTSGAFYRPGYDGTAYRRPDSDDPGDRFRLYELPGLTHTSTQYPPINDLQFLSGLIGFDLAELEQRGVRVSTLPFNQLFEMCLHHLVRWVADGVVPPRAERIEMRDDGEVAKDEFGNTRGGVRCAELDVPRAKYISNPPAPGRKVGFGGTYGLEERLDAATLQRLYTDKTDYLERYNKRLDELIDEGWFLAEDADELRAKEQRADLF
jgi:hypothetical protein